MGNFLTTSRSEGVVGGACEHYARRCSLKAPCCGKLYVCRLCHDAAESHQMDRFQVTEVECMDCRTLQPVQRSCRRCRVQFGEYYCDTCHLFDRDRKQYHCGPCGICRVGPSDRFFHCEKCNLCLPGDKRGSESHKCVENVSRQSCPVCLEDLHTSRIEACVLPCGHLLHMTCFDDMVKTTARVLQAPARWPCCPLCKHSINMEGTWKFLDIAIRWIPVPPPPLRRQQDAAVKIICNDCQAHCTVPFHVLGTKCAVCGSYNTDVIAAAAAPQPDPGES